MHGKVGQGQALPNADAVAAYQEEAARKSDFERTELNKEKTGVQLEGVTGINPVNGKEIPIFISDYVLMQPTAPAPSWPCPPTTTRDWEFAKKFGLPIIEVVKGGERRARRRPSPTWRHRHRWSTPTS